MKKILIILSIIVLVLSLNKKYELNQTNTIRFRIIANSNTKEDQKLKYEVIKNVSKVINESQKLDSINETRSYINNKLPEFDYAVKKTLLKQNSKNNYDIKFGLNYFPKKEYNNKEYPEGLYESLVITLGEGNGDNFWCILFPPLCMIEKNEDYEYKSFFKEIFNNFFE